MTRLFFLLLVTAGFVHAQDASPVEARLRESLRATTLQLRTAQNELSTAQVARDTLAEEKKALTAELAALQKQLVADRLENDRTVAALKATVAAQTEDLTATREELTKTRASLAKVVDYAKQTETARTDLSARATQLENDFADARDRNLALYKLSNEILDRYARFGLGEAILAREPFTGLSRVKLENLVQGYGDQLQSQRIKPADTATP
jgi:vacuolar-type H+-ATPase subunit D/Vma8